MIIYKATSGNTNLIACGSSADLFADTVILIKRIYEHIKMANEEQAEEYKDGIIHVLLDPDSPFYKKEDGENEQS